MRMDIVLVFFFFGCRVRQERGASDLSCSWSSCFQLVERHDDLWVDRSEKRRGDAFFPDFPGPELCKVGVCMCQGRGRFGNVPDILLAPRPSPRNGVLPNAVGLACFPCIVCRAFCGFTASWLIGDILFVEF